MLITNTFTVHSETGKHNSKPPPPALNHLFNRDIRSKHHYYTSLGSSPNGERKYAISAWNEEFYSTYGHWKTLRLNILAFLILTATPTYYILLERVSKGEFKSAVSARYPSPFLIYSNLKTVILGPVNIFTQFCKLKLPRIHNRYLVW